jgi:hypothetical protein
LNPGFTTFGNSHLRYMDIVRCEFLPIDTLPYSPRHHHFWECQIAQSLIRVLSSNLRMPVYRHQLWLALPPAYCMGRVWDVVFMAAGSALKDRWVLISLVHPNRPRCTIPSAKTKVLASFWSRLSSFASIGKNALAKWYDVPTTHPFLAWRDGTLTINQVLLSFFVSVSCLHLLSLVTHPWFHLSTFLGQQLRALWVPSFWGVPTGECSQHLFNYVITVLNP